MAMQTSVETNVEQTSFAKKCVLVLGEVVPELTMAGQGGSAEKLRLLRKDARARMQGVHGRVLASLRLDVAACMEEMALRGCMCDPADLSEEELQEAILAAENFIRRGRDYLGSLDAARYFAEVHDGKAGL